MIVSVNADFFGYPISGFLIYRTRLKIEGTDKLDDKAMNLTSGLKVEF